MKVIGGQFSLKQNQTERGTKIKNLKMTLSSFIDINSKDYKFIMFRFEVKDRIHDNIAKLRNQNRDDDKARQNKKRN